MSAHSHTSADVSTDNTAGESPIDLNQIAMLRGLRNGTVLPKLLRTYLDQLPTQLHDLRQAVDQRDASTISTIAHALKSASYAIGARLVGEACGVLETAARTNQLDNVPRMLLTLHEEVERARPCLEQYLP